MDAEDEVEGVLETQEVKVVPRNPRRMKLRAWTQAEEVALAKAYINVSQDPYKGNHQAHHSFWKKVLAEFNNHLEKDLWRNYDQVKSKWKDMNGKVTSFAGIYNSKMSNMSSDTNNEDVFKSATVAYMKKYNTKNGFSHLAAWEVVKSFPKWSEVLEETEDSTSKRARTSESNVRSSEEADFMPVYLDENQCDQDDLDELPTRLASPPRCIGKKPFQSLSTQTEQLMKMVKEFNAYNKDEAEDKKQARAKKLRLKEKKIEARIARDQEVASLVREQKRQMIEQQKQQDLEFILKSHDQYTGPLLQTVLARKREIAERWGWDF
uniref:glutathione S-transferase T3-like n=1 Tax=Erigeron canadensis TaxID=72917 RepID=UPI001CB95B6B|nr:glutathione S-transferase T3-like [Erigeron canadensis]